MLNFTKIFYTTLENHICTGDYTSKYKYLMSLLFCVRVVMSKQLNIDWNIYYFTINDFLSYSFILQLQSIFEILLIDIYEFHFKMIKEAL